MEIKGKAIVRGKQVLRGDGSLRERPEGLPSGGGVGWGWALR